MQHEMTNQTEPRTWAFIEYDGRAPIDRVALEALRQSLRREPGVEQRVSGIVSNGERRPISEQFEDALGVGFEVRQDLEPTGSRRLKLRSKDLFCKFVAAAP